ncbi:phosphomannomutase [Algiphilus sp.]|uniref:phosphomannomutase n=1 Tax=Algiphilus sp. TaxID=1872431 RepID=UPI003C7C4B3D
MTASKPASCFKAYDIRGRVPDELNPTIAYRLGLAYAQRFEPVSVALGCDIRHSSRSLLEAIALGLNHGGSRVTDIGYCGTEEIYFAAQQPGCDGGIMITASHNPADYNGMKLVRGGAIPISGDSGLRELEAAVYASTAEPSGTPIMTRDYLRPRYRRFLLDFIANRTIKPLRVVVNAGNGTAGLVIDALEPHLPLEFIRIHCDPDPAFPNGIPNPLEPDNRQATIDAVKQHGADFGVAWDGDFDRCFLFDENGRFIEGYYIVGLLAKALLEEVPGATIIHDPRLTWNTIDEVTAAGGRPVQSKTGHAFIKESMRAEDALYGGEMSAHHYFRAFGYCDNGTLPWLLVAALISEKGQPLSELVDERMHLFPASGEINRTVADSDATLAMLEKEYGEGAIKIDHTDGLSVEFAEWRFNVRASNTEPLLRLNVESRANEALMQENTQELLAKIESTSA